MQINPRPDICPDDFVNKCEQEALTCSICTEPYKHPQGINVCLHAFCKACIQESLAKKPSCPICIRPCSKENLIFDFDKEDRITRLWNKYSLKKQSKAAHQDLLQPDEAQKQALEQKLNPIDEIIRISKRTVSEIFTKDKSVYAEDAILNHVQCHSKLSLTNSCIDSAIIFCQDNQVTIELSNAKVKNDIHIASNGSQDDIVVIVTGSGKMGGRVKFFQGLQGEIIMSPNVFQGVPLEYL